ncbi:hypothetical protein [Aquimarina muelleri]|uniref:Uncharacterized protein n=1 Tax=Aquimarina muelleri TaxID=279356 RepID=A0A918JUR3_9FLAO|nr:hypothetical protein [Aquimarina muelleri]MCX2762267.1 hypothetical protein [Aquimarina muelleri]GGX17951.1 hypothetical protein GCM10007384_19260 [Aquimarina muelleri]
MNISYKLSKSILSITTSLFLLFSCNSDDDSSEPVVTESVIKHDLELTLKNYTNDQVISTGNVVFEFLIKNVGKTTIPAGTNVYLSLKINDTNQFDLTLTNTGEDAATMITIDNDLVSSGSFTYKQEPIPFLNVESTLQFLGVSSAKICSIAWGIDKTSIGTFESDLNSQNNTFCLTFGAN